MTSLEADEGVSLRWLTIAAGIWFVWVTVSSFSAGGYLAGRMRRRFGDATEDESDTRDGAHGVMVWATGALFAIFMATAGLGSALGITASATGAAAGGAASVMAESGDYFTDRMLRGVDVPPETRDEVATILARSVAEGEVSAEDRAYLVQLAASQTGTDPAQVEARIDEVLADLEQARQAAVEAAERARVAGVIAAFVLAATMLVSAGAAYFAAVMGGNHRDNNVAFRYVAATRRR
jgi:polyhydroxyalkanoate synthesis regulator phasin